MMSNIKVTHIAIKMTLLVINIDSSNNIANCIVIIV